MGMLCTLSTTLALTAGRKITSTAFCQFGRFGTVGAGPQTGKGTLLDFFFSDIREFQ